MSSGWIGKNPDTSWWKEQIKVARTFREVAAYEKQWDDWRNYYRGNWNGDILPKQLFFSTLRTLVPRVYFKNPQVSIVQRRPGSLETAFAQVQGRLDNALLDQMRYKQQARLAVQDTAMFGTGWLKIGLGGFYQPVPQQGENDIATHRGTRLEHRRFVSKNTPWVTRVHPGRVLVPEDLDAWENARWVAHEITRPEELVKMDPTFRSRARSQIRGTHTTDGKKIAGALPTSDRNRTRLVHMLEITDLQEGRSFVLAEEQDDAAAVLLVADDSLAQSGHMRLCPMVFNPDDEHFWGIPDAKMWEPYQLEANELRTQMMKQRRLSIAKLIAEKGSIDQDQAENLISEDVSPIIWKNVGSAPIDRLQPASVTSDNILEDNVVTQDFREVSGLSRNQTGEFQSRRGDTSATEAAAVQEAGEIRLDERRDVAADVLVENVHTINRLIFNHWTEKEVIDIVGPDGAKIWVEFQPSSLRLSEYAVKVDPDNLAPMSRDVRIARALRVYETMKTNPLIDPDRLTRFLLSEVGGADLDNLIRDPAQPGATPENPVGLQGLAQILQGAQGQALQ